MPKKFKIITVVGARPQFIKAAPLSIALAKTENLNEILVHTGQHYDYALSQIFFDELGLPAPHHNLEVGSHRHAVQMGQILIKLDAIVEVEKPDLIVVFGDTNSTAAAAIVAAKNNIPLAHVEAGLREWNKTIPEEVNKLLTDAVTDLYFCPTETGVKNLAVQGITHNVFNTGDIGIDLIINHLDKIEARKSILNELDIEVGNYFFMTCHRAANTDDPEKLRQILSIFQHLDTPSVLPLHPRTRAAIERNGLSFLLENKHLRVIEPIGFWDTQALIRHAKMVLTDSGGVIKEAYFHRVPCLILETKIEWVEAVAEGWSVLVGSQTSEILKHIHHFDTPSVFSSFLGNGTAAAQIVSVMSDYLEKRNL